METYMSVHLVMLTCTRGIMMNTAGRGDVDWHHREGWWSSRGRAGAAGRGDVDWHLTYSTVLYRTRACATPSPAAVYHDLLRLRGGRKKHCGNLAQVNVGRIFVQLVVYEQARKNSLKTTSIYTNFITSVFNDGTSSF